MSRPVVVEADGGSRGNPGPAGYGAVLKDAASGEVLAEAAEGIGVATNNVAEYRGLIAGLELALRAGADDVEVRMDSKLVVEQMSGRWKVRHPDMRGLAAEAATLVRRLPAVRFVHIPRERNTHADRLANEAMDAAAAGLVWAPRGGSAPAPARPVAAGPPTGRATVLWLLRHGETPLTAARRFSGLADVELSEHGRAQAAAAGRRLAAERPVDAIVTSPLRRARETAEVVGAALRVPVDVAADLRELDFGAWEGCTFAEVRERWPAELDAWLADPAVAPPGGESVAETERRAVAAVQRLAAERTEQRLLLVAHVTPLKAVVRWAVGAPPQALHRFAVDPASLSRVDAYADGPAVLRLLNDTAFLRVP